MLRTITNLLNGCDEKGYNSVVLPPISTGIFGFPKDLAARCIFQSSIEFFKKNPYSSLRTVKVSMIEDGTKTYEEFYDVMQEVKS